MDSRYANPGDGRMNAADPRRVTPRGELKMPKFVKFVFEDTGAGLDEIFWEDPKNFKPYRHPADGRVYSWGIFPIGEEGVPSPDIMQAYMRTMNIQMLYWGNDAIPKPELQFVNALIEKKVATLKGKDLGDFAKRDYTLDICVDHMPKKHQVTRSIRVSGGLSLAVFSDKVIKPLFGLVRNLHAHVFTDFTDGALFGPKDCSSVDMMHIDKVGYAYIPDKDYTIAHIVQKEGDTMGYYYDFGDNWYFRIKVIEIAPVENATGAITVLGGKGAHLPDGVASSEWGSLLSDVDKSPAKRQEALKKMYDSTSYSEQQYSSNFDFDHFSVMDTQRAVRAALDSKASIPSSSKQFVAPLIRNYEGIHGQFSNNLKRGQKVVRTPVVNDFGIPTRTFMEEGVSAGRPDRPGNTACSNCGSPNNLKACSGCKQKYYCTRSCQRAQWAQGHKKECKAPEK